MKYFIVITDEQGVVLDRFRIIDSSTDAGMQAIHSVEPGEEDAETESIPRPMAVAALVDRIQRVIQQSEETGRLEIDAEFLENEARRLQAEEDEEENS